eukprot:CAMPEP_0113952428 /NCGR_PEP_ID=MMETSP1339-20121228/90415_1 /TAXON_ID=94617 /ORGANISM="Fibrocapsa japonica" /LENGTH=388 /DNA_ID=CAMNT_0000961041 /DNA_START=54 /DNA_END=1217 /DNA_ORIENTATION=- /assembly_acc=CAM_ASM_000762
MGLSTSAPVTAPTTLAPTTAPPTLAPTTLAVVECPDTDKERWGVCGCHEEDLDSDNDGVIDCASNMIFHVEPSSYRDALLTCKSEGGYLAGPSEYAAVEHFLEAEGIAWKSLIMDGQNQQSWGIDWTRKGGVAYPPDHLWANDEPKNFEDLGDPNKRCTVLTPNGLTAVACRDVSESFVCRFSLKLKFHNDAKRFNLAKFNCKGDDAGRLAEASTKERLYDISQAAVEDFGVTVGEYFWIGAKNRCNGDGALWLNTDTAVEPVILPDDSDCYECLAVKAGASDLKSVEYKFELCDEPLKYMCESRVDLGAIYGPSDSEECTWVRNDRNRPEEWAGRAYSREQCISMVQTKCPDATIASIYVKDNTAVQGDSCYCQWGTDMTPEPEESW